MSTDPVLYKLVAAAEVPEDAWRSRLNFMGAYVGDKSKKFITLFTAEQLAGAVEAEFAGRDDAMLMSFNVETMVEEADLKIKFEAAETESGGTGAFAHAYGMPLIIPYACLTGPPSLLKLGEDGKHVFPPIGSALGAGGAGGMDGEGIESDPGTDDGLEPFNQHRFDEDD